MEKIEVSFSRSASDKDKTTVARLLDRTKLGGWTGLLSYKRETLTLQFENILPSTVDYILDQMSPSSLPALAKRIYDHVSDPDITQAFGELIEYLDERLKKLEKK